MSPTIKWAGGAAAGDFVNVSSPCSVPDPSGAQPAIRAWIDPQTKQRTMLYSKEWRGTDGLPIFESGHQKPRGLNGSPTVPKC